MEEFLMGEEWFCEFQAKADGEKGPGNGGLLEGRGGAGNGVALAPALRSLVQ